MRYEEGEYQGVRELTSKGCVRARACMYEGKDGGHREGLVISAIVGRVWHPKRAPLPPYLAAVKEALAPVRAAKGALRHTGTRPVEAEVPP